MTQEKENKLRDIQNIRFTDNLDEIVSSLDIILMMFEVNDDPEIISACKEKLTEGIKILKDRNYKDFESYSVE